jgi:hypothetical protein
MCIRRSREEEISKHVWRLGGVYVCLLLPRSLSAPLQSVEMSSSFFFWFCLSNTNFNFKFKFLCTFTVCYILCSLHPKLVTINGV